MSAKWMSSIDLCGNLSWSFSPGLFSLVQLDDPLVTMSIAVQLTLVCAREEEERNDSRALQDKDSRNGRIAVQG